MAPCSLPALEDPRKVSVATGAGSGSGASLCVCWTLAGHQDSPKST